MIVMARSQYIWDQYESYEPNLVLTVFGTDEYIQATGHGDLFQGQAGHWWGVCLGTRDDASG
jgi:beta-xylosidase